MLSMELGLYSIGSEDTADVSKPGNDSLRKITLIAMNKMIGWSLTSTAGKISEETTYIFRSRSIRCSRSGGTINELDMKSETSDWP